MLDKKFENLQWSFLDSVSQSSAGKNKCIQKEMGYQQGKWSKEEKLLHIDLENKQKFLIVVHFQIDSTTPLLYLVKMGEQGAKCY